MKKYIGLEEMSNGNCSSVLSVIRDCGEVSRKQISDITGLSWGGMTKIVNKLFEHEYIVEDKSENVTGIGRIPNVIRINKEQNFVIGLDINRMGFAAYVMNLAGDIIKGYFHAHNQRKEQQSENAASKELFDNKYEEVYMAQRAYVGADRFFAVENTATGESYDFDAPQRFNEDYFFYMTPASKKRGEFLSWGKDWYDILLVIDKDGNVLCKPIFDALYLSYPASLQWSM